MDSHWLWSGFSSLHRSHREGIVYVFVLLLYFSFQTIIAYHADPSQEAASVSRWGMGLKGSIHLLLVVFVCRICGTPAKLCRQLPSSIMCNTVWLHICSLCVVSAVKMQRHLVKSNGQPLSFSREKQGWQCEFCNTCLINNEHTHTRKSLRKFNKLACR